MPHLTVENEDMYVYGIHDYIAFSFKEKMSLVITGEVSYIDQDIRS